MTLRRAYGPILPEFDAFLFASVGEEVDGMPLSVLSALSRLGLEPRDEAARLARLTKEAAADQLARMITGLSERRWSIAEALRIASGLVEYLPGAGAAGKPERIAERTRLTTGFRAPGLAIWVALAVAMVVGLVASGALSLGG